jgi:hypothetical protein
VLGPSPQEAERLAEMERYCKSAGAAGDLVKIARVK